jgi:hypothetical protein
MYTFGAIVTSFPISTRRRATTDVPRPMLQRSPIETTTGALRSSASPGMPTDSVTSGASSVCEPISIHHAPNTSPGGNPSMLCAPKRRKPWSSSGDRTPTFDAHRQARCTTRAATRRVRGDMRSGSSTRSTVRLRSASGASDPGAGAGVDAAKRACERSHMVLP